MEYPGNLFVVAAPSGAGKSSLTDELIRRLRQTPDAPELLYTAHQTINGIAAGLRNSG